MNTKHHVGSRYPDGNISVPSSGFWSFQMIPEAEIPRDTVKHASNPRSHLCRFMTNPCVSL